LALVVAGVTLVVLFGNSDYNKGVIGAAVWFVLGIAYFAVHGRRGAGVVRRKRKLRSVHRKEEGLG